MARNVFFSRAAQAVVLRSKPGVIAKHAIQLKAENQTLMVVVVMIMVMMVMVMMMTMMMMVVVMMMMMVMTMMTMMMMMMMMMLMMMVTMMIMMMMMMTMMTTTTYLLQVCGCCSIGGSCPLHRMPAATRLRACKIMLGVYGCNVWGLWL